MRYKPSKVKFNTKLMLDVVMASLIVQKAPGLINMVVPIPESVQTIAGMGAGFLAGSMFKRPDLANASIALGAIEFISPLVDQVIGGGSGSGAPLNLPGTSSMLPEGITGGAVAADLADYIRLNEYVSNPSAQLGFDSYKDSY